jgi:hypothetical protein
VISGDQGPIHGSIVMSELNRLENQIRLDDEAAGTQRTPAERRALALVEMARRSGSTASGSKPLPPLFTVLLGEDSFTHLCELTEGVMLPPAHPSGCDVPADWCDVDHVIPYSEHGLTDQFNGRLQCRTQSRIPARHMGSGLGVVDATPHPTVLDQIRGRLRYRMRHDASDAA